MSGELEFCGPASEDELAAAERALGRALPTALRRMYLRPRRFSRGDNGVAFVELLSPMAAVELTQVVTEFEGRAAMFVFGGDGSREMLLVDSRLMESPVYLMDITGSWETAVVQTASVDALLAALEDGTFELTFED